jgi:thymidylate synthase (FAD)
LRVKLLAWTSKPELLAKIASKTCYSEVSPVEMKEEDKYPDLLAIVRKGHLSVIEHCTFTFAIEGISRVASHELVRHRIASYSQQSQRVARPIGYVTPPLIEASPEAKKVYEEVLRKSTEAYEKLIELGIPLEDARFVLPNAMHTNIVVTMNARSLLNFFRLRCCLRAQWEIRELAYRMLELVKEKMPTVFANAGAPCQMDGTCPEMDTKCKWYAIYVKPRSK